MNHLMASEIQCCTCRELYDPSLTSQAPSTENIISLKDLNRQLETMSDSNGNIMPIATDLLLPEEGLHCHVSQLTTGFRGQGSASPESKTELSCPENSTDIEYTPPLVIAAEEELPNDGKQFGTTIQIQSIIIRPPSTSVSSPNRQSLQEISLHQETPLDEGTNSLAVYDRPQTSLPGMHMEHTSDSYRTEITQRHDNPTTSDQVDDEVQFILSVARKKRKKGARLDPRLGDSSQRSKTPPEKDSGENVIQHAHQNERSNLQAACLETADSQNVSHKLSGMNHAGNGASTQPMSIDFLRSPDFSPALPTCKQRNKGKRKDRDDKSQNLPEDLPATTTSAVNSCYPPKETPLLPQHHHLTQSLSMNPLTRIRYMPGTNPGVAGQSDGKIENHIPLGRGQQSPPAHTRSAQSHVYWPVQLAPYLNQDQRMLPASTESLRRRPSLYGIPQWHGFPPDKGMTPPTTAANWAINLYQSPYGFKSGDLNKVPQMHSNGPENGTLPLPGSSTHGNFPSCTVSTKPLSIQQPKAPSAGAEDLRPKHPRNMLVDIAQTCQDNFPFALIAKRHNQPIQKVFDTFSAVIQLPLLRSAVDARRPGKLGSLRMKEFNAMKKNAKKLQKEIPARKSGKNVQGNVNISS